MNDSLILASGNPGKAREVQAILASRSIQVRLISEVAPSFDVLEDGDTFEANAIKKALEAHRITGGWVLADDSGLCVRGLDGGPGIHSARYAGEDATDLDRNRLLLQNLETSGADRRAWFHCSMAAVLPAAWLAPEAAPACRPADLPGDARLVVTEGQLHGLIGQEMRGEHGFGYDPLFLPEGYNGMTLAELDAVVKNEISHRARALRALALIVA